MRQVVLILMLVLLPLRGWVGDAMAMELTAAPQGQPLAAIETGAYHAHESAATADSDTEHATHADCPGHVDSTDDNPQVSSHCESCTACQICHAVALTSSAPHLVPANLPAARPQAAARHFASADRALGIKPPIS